jgi:hypothetical protein
LSTGGSGCWHPTEVAEVHDVVKQMMLAIRMDGVASIVAVVASKAAPVIVNDRPFVIGALSNSLS